jgi:hypothetical protein
MKPNLSIFLKIVIRIFHYDDNWKWVFNLSGSQQTYIAFKNSASFADSGLVNEMTIIGPHLSVIHTYNYCVANEIYIR